MGRKKRVTNRVSVESREFPERDTTLTIIGSSLIHKATQIAEAVTYFELDPTIVLAEQAWKSTETGIGYATDQWHSLIAGQEVRLSALSHSGTQHGIWNYARHRRAAKRSAHLLIILGKDTPMTAEYVDAIIAAKEMKCSVYVYRVEQGYV